MRRRDFIAGIAVSTAMPLTARAQQSEQVRRIGVLMNLAPDDPEGQTRLTGFLRGLQESGWADGGNAHIDTRWGTDAGSTRKHAAELVALAPDVIMASGSATTSVLQETTRTVPIVFVGVIDPVGAGYVESLARPGDNLTGFSLFEYGFSGKWLELLKEIAPRMTQARSFAIPVWVPDPVSMPLSKRWRRRLEWSCTRSTCVTLRRSSALSQRSRAFRTVG